MKRKKTNKKVTIIKVVAAVHDLPQLFMLHIPAGTRISDFFADADTLSHDDHYS